MRARLFSILFLLALALIAPTVQATPPSIYDEFTWTQYYTGDHGLAVYYGEDVKIVYEAVNKWHVESREIGDGVWTIEQELTQKGMAYVYTLDDELLDMKNFRVVEITHGTVSEEIEWYYILSFDHVDKWEYHWIISGIYHFIAKGSDFDIEDYWSSVTYVYWVKDFGWTQMWPPP